MTIGQTFRNVAELAQGKIPIASSPTFKKIFSVKVFDPECRASPELAQKYGVAMDNVQQVVAIQNLVTSDLTWWNPARKTKPQNFKANTTATATASGIHDPTGGGGPAKCDFCGWQNLTAEDTFGRVEGPFAVTASNLFKYAAPFQGVVLFKHHDPLSFNFLQLSDLLNVADGWFYKAMLEAEQQEKQKQKESMTEEEISLCETSSDVPLYPLLVWNCLGRAGASQYHGHAQVMVSGAPFPAMKRESDAAMQYHIQKNNDSGSRSEKDIVNDAGKIIKQDEETKNEMNFSDEPIQSDTTADYYRDVVAAHQVVGLARRLILPNSIGNKNTKDICDALGGAIWHDDCASDTTSPSLSSSTVRDSGDSRSGDANASIAKATAHVSLCPTKDAEIVIHGSSVTCPAFQMLFYAALRALIDELGVQSFNAGIHNIPTLRNRDNSKENTSISEINKNISAPVIARVVSRGRLSSGASDFGGLEVFAGASIGHTDPWTVMEALDTSLKRALKE